MALDPNAPAVQQAQTAPSSAPAPTAPAPAAPPPVVSGAPASVPSGIDALAQPGVQNTLDAVKGATDAQSTAYQNAAKIANTPTPQAKPVPHARLMAMIEGLSVGLSAAGASIGSHGREGGAPEVQQYY